MIPKVMKLKELLVLVIEEQDATNKVIYLQKKGRAITKDPIEVQKTELKELS